jgi:hypothetical protein
MIGLLPILAVIAAAQAPASDHTALYFRCDVPVEGRSEPYKLELTYFDPPPSWAYALNYKDFDHLFPTAEESKASIVNMWPTALTLAFPDTKRPRARPLAAVLIEPAGQAGRASLKIRWSQEAGVLQAQKTGTCSYTEGEVAKAEYRQVLAQ